MESRVSHHHPIFGIFELDMPVNTESTSSRPKYDYCESNMNMFLDDVRSNFAPNQPYNEVNFEVFVNKIKSLIDKNFLIESESFKRSKRNMISNPWITPGIIASVKRKEFLYKQWKKTISKENLLGDTELYLIFSKFRRELKHVIKYAKKLYYCRKFSKVSGNMKQTWALINELRGKSKTSIKSLFKINGELVKDKREISNGFNMFFSSIASKLNAKLYSSRPLGDGATDASAFNYQKYFNKRVNNSIFLYPCDQEEIE